MRYYYECDNRIANTKYLCKIDHPLYSSCSLVLEGNKGLAIVQKRFNSKMKIFWYGAADSWLVEDIVTNEGWDSYFAKNSGDCTDGLYPTVTVRQVMWTLRMKPLKKEWWESQDLQAL